MVESSRAKINFIKLTTEELSRKIALLVSNHSRIIYWKNSPRFYEGVAGSFNIDKKIILKIEKNQLSANLQGERICLNFILNDIDYFLRGKVLSYDQEYDQLVVELEEECFRAEKRSKERLRVFPVYDVMVYFKFKRSEEKNIIFLNKKEQINQDFFAEIDNIQKNKIASLARELEISDEEDLIGFRIEDISSTGLSFFATSKEKEKVLDRVQLEELPLIIIFEREVYHLENASFVYKMNYINSQFSNVPMYKIGMNFKASASLKKKIEDVSGVTVDLINYQNEFEEFMKNE
jgi:hypothetical protein